MLRALLPVITAYCLFVLMVVSATRMPAARPSARSWWLGDRRRGLVRHLITTTAGGYGVFLAIVAVFHTWVGSERGALASALAGGTVLAVVVLGLFAGLSRFPRRPPADG
jgi:UDP-N-acetylmuramyl pentapeptide phosphotransferase/UDP-N-acetylglucosamine-1-phosphate transferase